MQIPYDAREIICNLQAAGCGSEEIERFLELFKKGKTREQQRMLADIRLRLLEAVHKGERQIDCLDYLVYQLQRKPGT